MTILTNSVLLQSILNRVFGGLNYIEPIGGINSINFCSGAFPLSATSLGSTSNFLQGNVPSAGLSHGRWSAPSAGISILLDPVSIVVRSDSPPSTLDYVALSVNNYNIYVIPVDTVSGPDNGVVNKKTGIVGGDIVTLSDLRIKVATEGNFCMNYSLANAVIKSIIAKPGGNPNYSGAFLFGSSTLFDSSGSAVSNDLLIEIYDSVGQIPQSCNQISTDTLLWSLNLNPAGGNGTLPSSQSIFSVSGNSVTYDWSGSISAINSGIPKYVRITQKACTVGDVFYPEMVLQVPIGNGVGMVPAPAASMDAGSSYSLSEFSFILKP